MMDNNSINDNSTIPEAQPAFGGALQEAQPVNTFPAAVQPASKPKKKKWPIVLLAVLAVLAMAGVVTFLIINANKDDSASSSESSKSGQLRKQELLNEELASTDTMSAILKYDGTGETYTVFIGFELDDVSKDLVFDSFSNLHNESMRVIEYMPMGISFEFGDRVFYDFSLSIPLVYRPGNTSKKASINNCEIVYNEGNYYVVYNDFLNDYQAYYKYGTTNEDGLANGEESWLLVDFGLYDTQEEAIARVKKLSATSLICSFSEGDIKSNCEGYQNYNNINDIVLKELNSKAIFVGSYKNVRSIDALGGVSIMDDSGRTRITIGYYDADASDFGEGYREFEMDGRKYYYGGYQNYFGFGTIYEPIDDGVIGYSISLADDIEKTPENVINVFKDTFGKYE